MNRRLLACASLSVLAAAASQSQARAQSVPAAPPNSAASGAEGATLGEVIVTAQRRSENVQTTALAVTAIGGEALRERQINNIEALAQTIPNVNIGDYLGSARVTIRGVGFDNINPGSEARAAYHVDGVYVSRPEAALATFFDVDRIEVVRGPQGTLYGRNATAGAVNVVTRNPTDHLTGDADLTVGSQSLVKFDGAVGGPLAPGVSARIAVQTVDRDGYGTNATNGLPVDDEHDRALRAKVRFQLNPKVDLLVSADYFYEKDHSNGFHYQGAGSPGVVPTGLLLGGVAPSGPYDMTGDVGPLNHREAEGFSADLNVDLGWAQFVSLSAFRHITTEVVTDLDATSAPVSIFDLQQDSDQYSQEFRLQGKYARGNWLVGLYYFNESVDGYNAIPLDREVIGLPSLFTQGYYVGGNLGTQAYAAFGQGDFAITPNLSLVFGARYSSERKTVREIYQFDVLRPYTGFLNPIAQASDQQAHSWDAFTPKVSLEWKPLQHLFAYVTYAEGFKSGGFNLGGLQPPFNPETIKDYEGGIKADWFGRRLRTNISAFYYDYSDLQVTKVVGASVQIENAAAAKLYGAELEIVALPIPRLEIDANLSLLHSEYTRFFDTDPARSYLGELDLKGNHLNQAPSYTLNLAAQYLLPVRGGDLTLRGEGVFVDKVYFSPFNLDYVAQGAHSKFNSFLTYKPAVGDWAATFYARNLGDVATKASSVVGTILFGYDIVGAYEPPRTFGFELSYRF